MSAAAFGPGVSPELNTVCRRRLWVVDAPSSNGEISRRKMPCGGGQARDWSSFRAMRHPLGGVHVCWPLFEGPIVLSAHELDFVGSFPDPCLFHVLLRSTHTKESRHPRCFDFYTSR